MPRCRKPIALGLALVLVVIAGCQSRLNVDAAYQLEPGVMKDTEIDAPRYDQKVVVTVNSNEPVDVYVYLKKDRDTILAAVAKNPKQAPVLASKEAARNETLEVTLPAKETAVITVATGLKPRCRAVRSQRFRPVSKPYFSADQCRMMEAK